MNCEDTTRPKVIAVTGGSGFIGRCLLPLLAGTTAEVRLLTRREQQQPSSGIPVKGDLLDSLALQRLVAEADAVIHLAGVAHTDLRNTADRAQAHAVNVEGTRRLLQAARAAGVPRFLYLSSAHVYAGQRGLQLTESSPTRGDGAYASMKLEAEQALYEAAAEGMSVAILRPCLVYGPGARHNLQKLMQAIQRRRFVTVSGAQTERSMASVHTVAQAILHLLWRPDCTGTYNIADRDPIILEQWVNDLALLLDVGKLPAVPLALLKIAAAAGSAADAIGLPAPLTLNSLAKLTTPFSLDVTKLAATGFQWPTDQGEVLRAMVAADFPTAPLKQGRF